MRATRDQSREVRHVDEVERADFVRNLPHARKINNSRIRAAAADDQLGMLALGDLFEIVVVDRLGFFGHAVRNDLVGLAGKIQMMPVREMPAMRQVQAENRVARLQDRRIRRHVGLRPGVRLHVGVLGTEQLLGAIARQVLHHIGELAAAVVALAGISLRILIRKDRSGGLQHGFADEILRGDQLQAFMLAARFVINRRGDLRDRLRTADGTWECFSVTWFSVSTRFRKYSAAGFPYISPAIEAR